MSHTYAGFKVVIILAVFNVNLWKNLLKCEMLCWAASDAEVSRWFENMIPDNYSSGSSPNYNRHKKGHHSKNPAEVTCKLTAHSVTQISMKTMDFDVDLEVEITWHDRRLQLPPEANLDSRGTNLPPNVARRLWFPVFRFMNCKEGDNRLITPDVGGQSGVILIADEKENQTPPLGLQLKVEYRETLRFRCMFKFERYPFDVQHCLIRLQLATRNTAPVMPILNLGSKQDPIPVPAGFNLLSVYSAKMKTRTGTRYFFICKNLDFKLQRVYDQHLILTFYPSILIVVLSWIAFWLDVENSAPRVALGLTTILTLSTMFNSAQKDLPPVADVKSLDIWMFSCLFMVFASLLEFSLATFCRRIKINEGTQRVANQPICVNSNAQSEKPIQGKLLTPTVSRKARLCHRVCWVLKPGPKTSLIDYAARIVFPIAFIIFNIWFWHYYL